MQKLVHTTVTALMALCATLMMSTTASAHPGHDHMANEAMLIHVLFYGSIATAVLASTWFVYRHFSKQK